jgi:hypothetical protein
VVHPPAAVERHLGDADFLGLGGDGRADLLGGGDVPAVLQVRAADIGAGRGDRDSVLPAKSSTSCA